MGVATIGGRHDCGIVKPASGSRLSQPADCTSCMHEEKSPVARLQSNSSSSWDSQLASLAPGKHCAVCVHTVEVTRLHFWTANGATGPPPSASDLSVTTFVAGRAMIQMHE